MKTFQFFGMLQVAPKSQMVFILMSKATFATVLITIAANLLSGKVV